MTVDITTPSGKVVSYRDTDVVEAQADGDEIAECDRCSMTEIAELLIPHGGSRYCEYCAAEMIRR